MASEADKTAVKLAMDELLKDVDGKDIGEVQAVLAGRRDWEQSRVYLMVMRRDGKEEIATLEATWPFDKQIRTDLLVEAEAEKEKVRGDKEAIKGEVVRPR